MRNDYVKRVAEATNEVFLAGGDALNVEAIVIAGVGELKHDLKKSDALDRRIKQKIVKVIDLPHGGTQGFAEAIELSKKDLEDLKLAAERKALGQFNKEIAMNSNKACYGIQDTMALLEMGAISTLIVDASLKYWRVVLKNPETKENYVKYISKNEAENIKGFLDITGKTRLKVISKVDLLEWLTEVGAEYISHC